MAEVVAVRTYLIVTVILLVLLGLTLLVASLELGAFALVIAMLIAAIKATLVALIFMHLRTSSPITRVFALAGLLWLIILVGYTLNDFVTRGLLKE